MKKASLIVFTAIVFLMSVVPVFAKETKETANQELRNVQAFAKLYGYVRFFHPSDENTQIDWNRFAIYGVGKVRAAKTTDELTTTLQELFYPIAPTMNLTKQGNATRLSPRWNSGFDSYSQSGDMLTPRRYVRKYGAACNRWKMDEAVKCCVDASIFAH
ncbi:hypothetical protein WJ0W_002242 [Paenibacillus melissococcoides]|uniref:Uncharacterized protein n=1 Tax=Paenibacillus melissococcoides TaxID=2912268 RepID=A0ABN8U5J8_9BACL|nr:MULTISPECIES: hypothetical protein [Paenibacillus]GIO81091.1 hypothetical protein J6TS7_47010 [Paenibacillus dendritiformis]CAH8245012.1 hypothetical protein WJ0W_002242 [Paenibacillus melissococcoides]CAH8709640.1 hypothetical protein WDD9_002322 [Paenibacillus melissococcoides]CAH8710366.1 hypothetical protein HTL2_002609 [Paenibacillus melissococcoides]